MELIMTLSSHLEVLKNSYCLGIQDIYQKVLVLQGKTLRAVPEDGNVTPISLKTTPCQDESLEKGKGNAIYLGIEGQKLCLCCAESGGQPILKLEERGIMELYHNQKAEKPFVFYQNAASNTSTFESAAYPGWFISSSVKKQKPITLTKDVGKDNINFYLMLA
ncbi:interleukin-36 alpha-like [Petaurus breviceps papuanus]|uniref:interleukin-36 alpha-like n=1 Tax=Petaurus breviceps papuanus TaxID=3040969 RepID=UPI0036D9AA21